ncbi:hypothetical protein GCM10010429_32970 [Micromonospora olivasterospora]
MAIAALEPQTITESASSRMATAWRDGPVTDMGERPHLRRPGPPGVWGSLPMPHGPPAWQVLPQAQAGQPPPTTPSEEVNVMKKITIRKTGSIKLTTSAPLYCTDCC